MEEQKKILKISLKTVILIFFIIVAISIGFYIIIWNHFEKKKTDNEKENINSKEYKYYDTYDTIEYIGEDGTLGVTIYKENKTVFELVNKYGETICSFGEMEYKNHINNTLILINKENLYKIIDTKGNIIFEEISISNPQIISDNEQDKFISFKKDETVKIINLQTKEIISNYEYEDVGYHETADGLIKVIKDGKYGFIDEKGNIIINLEYDNLANYFLEDMIVAKKDGKCGCIDKNENTVINFEYDRIGNFSEGLISAKKGNKIGFLDKQGNIVIDFQYEYDIDNEEHFKNEFNFFTDMPEFREDVALVYKDNWNFFIDKSGKKAIDFETEFKISDQKFNNDFLIGQKNEKYGIFNKNGKLVVDFIYDEIQNYETIELLTAKLNDKWGCIDKNGNVIINFEFDQPLNFDFNSDGIIDEYLIVEKNKKYGCIDKNGNILVEFKYDNLMETANNNFLLANLNNKIGIINTKGEIVKGFEYDEFSFYNIEFVLDKHFGVKSNLFGIINNILDNQLRVKPKLLGAFRKGEIWEILDIEGNEIGTYKCKSK
ncbi:MAG: WG repeat-containing protein [Clostridia bacterium]|nr:WG repeat-containing protein [Clostridia bacterium]